MRKYLFLKIVEAIKALATRKVSMECDHIPYNFDHVPIKKILNWLLVETSIAFNSKKAWGWPTHLQIEPSTFCNLRCAFCPITAGMRRLSGNMEFGMFKKVIDEIGAYVFLILLWDWGEPFLNPSIYNMIAYAKARNIKIVSSTNVHLFISNEEAEKLVHSGIDSIICAVDGISQETYEIFRAHGDMNTAIAGIQNIVSAKKRLHSNSPFIHLRFLPTRHNEHEIPKLKEFAESLDVDALSLKTINPYNQAGFNSPNIDENEFIPKNPAFQRFKYDASGFRKRGKVNSCKNLWNCPAIHWDGKVSPCTFDPNDSFTLGDLSQETFKAIWMGTGYRSFRRGFRENYKNLRLCSNCTYAFENGACSTESIAKVYFFHSPY